MIRTILTAVAIVLLTASAHAQTITTYAAVKSNYAFGEFGFTQHPDPVFQGGTTASWENGIFIDVWASTALDGSNAGGEIDYTFGWAGSCGNFSCTASIALFDLPTPDVGDMDFLETDIVRFRGEISRGITINDANSITIMGGIDQLTGLIETNLWRTSASWNHQFDADWSSNLLVGATYNADPDTTTFRWSGQITRSFENWNMSAEIGGYESPHGQGHELTYGLGVSRTF